VWFEQKELLHQDLSELEPKIKQTSNLWYLPTESSFLLTATANFRLWLSVNSTTLPNPAIKHN
jgi:hypothetical protein